jgi:hypothetical protein
MRLKYVKNHPICLIPNRMTDSPLWKDLMKVRCIYLRGREYKINSGRSVSFWLDPWMGEKPLCVIYPVLYDLSLDQKKSVSDIAENGWVVRFKIRLQGILRDQWHELDSRLNEVNLNTGKDEAIWKWIGNKKFSLKSVLSS